MLADGSEDARNTSMSLPRAAKVEIRNRFDYGDIIDVA